MVVGLLGRAALWASEQRPKLQRAIWCALVAFCTLCVIYSMVGVRVYSYLRTPLTYQLIYVAGDFSNMRSSLGVFLTVSMVLSMVFGTFAYLGLTWYSTREIGVPSGTLLPRYRRPPCRH